VQISILTPLPGTQLMEQLQNETRLVYQEFPEDWDKYRFSYIVHQPEGIDKNNIYIGDNYIKKHLYSFPTYQYRLLKSFFNLTSMTNFYTVFKLNQALKTSWQHSHYFKKYPTRFNF
jgi:hypothetical protein